MLLASSNFQSSIVKLRGLKGIIEQMWVRVLIGEAEGWCLVYVLLLLHRNSRVISISKFISSYMKHT